MLLKAWGNGDQAALDRLTPLVYAELHRMARRHMGKERENTLQTTALVNEPKLLEGPRKRVPRFWRWIERWTTSHAWTHERRASSNCAFLGA